MTYMVLGCWPETKERYLYRFDADSPRDAENIAHADADRRGSVFWVAAVIPGAYPVADLYTGYVNPDDERNPLRDDLEPAVPGVEDSEWTVFGIIRQPGDTAWNRRHGGQRYSRTVHANSARQAEDIVTRVYAAAEGGELWVCAVVEGRHDRADTYAKFVDPDMTTLAEW